jgi:hypothetical protein
VETALAAKRYKAAREAATDLVRQADTALRSGRIAPDQAERIQAAVARLVADLPAPAVKPTISVAPSPQATSKPEHPKPKKRDHGPGEPKPKKKH